jgi:ATP/ADP translocase
MVPETALMILEQIGVILISVILLVLLYQWIDRSRVNERDIERTLLKAKVIREEAMERSKKILSKSER